MKILHISDLHFPCPLPLLSLRGKMIAGYVNFTLRRQGQYPQEITQAMIRFIQNTDYDILVISGDVVNVSHELEFQNARNLLSPVLDERTFMIPGNHDRYMPGAIQPVDLYEKYFGEFSGESISTESYLRVKKVGTTHFIGWDSSKPRSLLDAYGEIPEEVIENTTSYLKKNKIDQYFLVCHHPLWNPEAYTESNHHRMQDREQIVEKLKKNPPIMVFHGHSHINWVRNKGHEIPFWIVNSASSTRVSDQSHPTGFHLVEWNQTGIAIKRFSFAPDRREFLETVLLGYDK